jgi:hypothetical protein
LNIKFGLEETGAIKVKMNFEEPYWDFSSNFYCFTGWKANLAHGTIG